MAALGVGILDDPGDAERLAALRNQRMLLRELRDDVDRAFRATAAGDLAESWRSTAQRAYAERLGELRRDLMVAWRQLDEALTVVHAAIARLTAAE